MTKNELKKQKLRLVKEIKANKDNPQKFIIIKTNYNEAYIQIGLGTAQDKITRVAFNQAAKFGSSMIESFESVIVIFKTDRIDEAMELVVGIDKLMLKEFNNYKCIEFKKS